MDQKNAIIIHREYAPGQNIISFTNLDNLW